ncbi:MAG: HAMP domain-containing histidine kinase [Natronospirillum sp.]|uniref:sensor histidine kinase n=1 Tax=Natronospirillum sp. TaxID=2812955 RepID=UPI0025E594A8|nr:HAMP domain-containing sensor histidine kinase [Natronospirillum sp.]MCH8550385.1 HAMP domain-containing histidine kinase [Natronospirillum sp.]
MTDKLQLDGLDEDEATLAGTSDLLKRLLSAEQHMRQMLVDHPASVLVVDSEGLVQLSNNAARELLLTIGVEQANLYMGKSVERVFPGVMDLDQIELPADPERCDAGHVVLMVKRTPVAWGKGPATLVLLHDVTAQVDAQQQLEVAVSRLEEVNQLKSEFITMASHEFRTPLTSVLSSLELINEYLNRAGDSVPPEVRGRIQSHIDRSKTSVGHLDTMVADMLVLEKSHGGQFQVRPERLRLKPLVDGVLDTLAPIGEKQQVQVNVSVSKSLEADLDPRLLRHILTNLISNAVRFSHEGEQVQVSLRQVSGHLQIQVADHGSGIAEADQAHIFDTFFRGQNSQQVPGSGLGLTIVKRFVDLQGGEIRVSSAPRQGATFTVTFPLLENSGAVV